MIGLKHCEKQEPGEVFQYRHGSTRSLDGRDFALFHQFDN
jgi:hypothetical protein